jgi:hypothetical protein
MYRSKILLLICLLSGCTHTTSWDIRPITLKYLNLDDKLEELAPVADGWELDLSFRHARLGLINDEINRDHPDVVTFIGVEVKNGSPAESDIAVLSAGELGEYEWIVSQTSKGADQAEKIVAATAAALPVTIDQAKTLSVKERWSIGNDGFAVASYLTNSSSPFVILNVKMPSRIDLLQRSYELLEQAVYSASQLYKVCIGRILIIGFLPHDSIQGSDLKFLTNTGFKDSATGVCERIRECSTKSDDNELAQSLYGNTLGQRDERLFFHETVATFYSRPAFHEGSSEVAKDFPEYGFDLVHPSTRFGWESKILLPKCE